MVRKMLHILATPWRDDPILVLLVAVLIVSSLLTPPAADIAPPLSLPPVVGR